MKITRWILTLLVVVGVLWVGTTSAWAWDDCPLGLVNDPYPGACPRYIDTNNDGICDHSQSDPALSVATESAPISPNDGVSLPTETGLTDSGAVDAPASLSPNPPVPPEKSAPNLDALSALSNRKLKIMTVADLASFGIPSNRLLTALAGRGISADSQTSLASIFQDGEFSRSTFLQFCTDLFAQPSAGQNPDPALPLIPVAPTQTASASGTSTGIVAVVGYNEPPNPSSGVKGVPEELWVAVITAVVLILMKSLALLRTVSRGRSCAWFTLKNYRWSLNLLLTFTFAVSFFSGALDTLALSFRWFAGWERTIVTVHLDSSLAFLLVAAVHTFWHWPYYRTCWRKAKQLRRQNRKAFWRWGLNLALTASFLISLVSGVLDLLPLRFHLLQAMAPFLLDVHIYSSLVMMGIGVAHTLWHLPYYRHHARRKSSVAAGRGIGAIDPRWKPIEQTGTRSS
jgi:uncharacterized membrane protein YfcA